MIDGVLHDLFMSGSWEILVLFYGIIFLYVGYKFLKSIAEDIQETAESGVESFLCEVLEWVIAITPLTIVFLLYYLLD